MKTFRLAFLLGILSTTLVGCGNGGGPKPVHTITFDDSKGCTMVNSKGESVTSANVIDGTAVSYTIKVNDPTTYNIPFEITITCDEKDYSDYSYNRTDGSLSIPSVNGNLAIVAVAQSKDGHSILYHPTSHEVSHITWDSSNPSHIPPNTDLEVKFKADYNYEVKKDDVSIKMDGGTPIDFSFLPPITASDPYTVKVSKTELVNDGVIVINCIAQHVPEAVYNVTVNLGEHITSDFPATVIAHSELGSYIQAEEGYRLPDSVTVLAQYEFVEGTDYVYNPNAGEYEGRPYGYIYIYASSIIMGRSGIQHDVTITGDAVQLVTVTFDPNTSEGGRFEDGTDLPKTTTVDINTTLGDAAQTVKAFATIDKDGWNFDKWLDENGKEVYTTDPLTRNIVVTASYAEIEYTIFKELSNASAQFPNKVKWHEAVGTITIMAAAEYRLPEKTGLKVYMGLGDKQQDITEKVTYTLEEGNKRADFSIPAGIIEDNIYIYLTAYQEVAVTFDPGEGQWQIEGKDPIKTPQTVTVKKGEVTYNEALSSLKLGGEPQKAGFTFGGWYYEGGAVPQRIEMTNKVNLTITIKAHYELKQTFEFDSWANIISHANEGITSFVEYYGAGVFVGAHRHLTVEDSSGDKHDYEVRLIGYNHDDLTTPLESGQTKATLTFEFVNLIGSGIYGSDDQQHGINNWANSAYRSNLSTFYNSLKENNSGFEVKQVKKKTIQGKAATEEEAYLSIETNEYLFPLSGAEIGISGTNHAAPANTTEYKETKTGNEGTTYEFYNLGYTKGKKYLDSATETDTDSYWLRSPNVHSIFTEEETLDTAGAYMMFYRKNYQAGWEGIDFQRYGADAEYGYTAAFCI